MRRIFRSGRRRRNKPRQVFKASEKNKPTPKLSSVGLLVTKCRYAARSQLGLHLDLAVELFQKLVDGAVKIFVGAALLVDLGDGVHDGGVVLVAELTADFRKARLRELLGQVHGDLARNDDVARVVFLLEVGDAHAKLLGDGALDGLDGDLADLHVNELLEALLR